MKKEEKEKCETRGCINKIKYICPECNAVYCKGCFKDFEGECQSQAHEPPEVELIKLNN